MKVFFTQLALCRIITVCIAFLIVSSHVWSQDRALNVYSNQLIYSIPNPKYFDSEKDPFTFHGISIAYQKSNEGISRQFEFGSHFRNKDEPNERYSTNYLHLRYEKVKRVEKLSSDQFKFSLGKTLRLHYQSESINARSFSEFERENKGGGLSFSFLAAAQFEVTPNVFLDFRVSSIGVTLGLNSSRVENPNFREDLRTTSGFDFDLLTEFLLRTGIGYRF